MLRTILTPLRARFDLSPRTPASVPLAPEQDDDLAPEDFARDVLIELMRNSVENLKAAEDRRSKVEVLNEILRILQQDAHTKDVFRELDGFLVLISLLSTIRNQPDSVVVEPEEQVLTEVLEATRLSFEVLFEGIRDHDENVAYFKSSVGYDSLEHALEPLLNDPQTVDAVLSSLLSLALEDFSLSKVLQSLRGIEDNAVDSKLNELQPRLKLIRHPEAISILWRRHVHLDTSLHYAVAKLFLALVSASHRNQAVMSTLGLEKPMLDFILAPKVSSQLLDKHRSLFTKLVRRLLEMGATTADTRLIFQRALNEGQTLEQNVLEIIRSGMKSCWMEHLSLEGNATLALKQENIKSLPSAGFTFMTWIRLERLPMEPYTLFTARIGSRKVIALRLRPDGCFALESSSNKQEAVLIQAMARKARWTHVALVHYPHRSTQPPIRLFLDGVLSDTLDWAYPKAEWTPQEGTYSIGDSSTKEGLSWCMTSAYLLSLPLSDDFVRLVQHFGARYTSNFQDSSLRKFITYDASTSLNMFLTSVAKIGPAGAAVPIVKALKEGMGIPEKDITFSLSPVNVSSSGHHSAIRCNNSKLEFETSGDVFVVKAACMDEALWRIGGAAVTLRLVQVADSPHELSRTINILTDGLRSNWQNSEDMERLRGYDILADILRQKAGLINMTSFETLFEFLGISFKSPEHSTVVNTPAYTSIALDFELWSRTRTDIQRVHLEHFTLLLNGNKHKKYNVHQRLAKMALIPRLLFVLQTDWYPEESLPLILDALRKCMTATFSQIDTIKPVVAYLAANLHEDTSASASPRSIISRIDYKDSKDKASMLLQILVELLISPTFHQRFVSSIPLPRVCLLLLGDKPTPFIASQVLRMIAISNKHQPSFGRKFELINGWSVLKAILPASWDPTVNEAAFNVLLGQVVDEKKQAGEIVVVCPSIMPSIMTALHVGLKSVAENIPARDTPVLAPSSSVTESTIEALLEVLIDLHSSTPTFRQLFRSQQTTQIFIDSYKTFATKLSTLEEIPRRVVSMLEKVLHFGMTLALDAVVAGPQKKAILENQQLAESIISPSSEKTTIDPSLVADQRTMRQRIASARFSVQVSERTVLKIIMRIQEWRKTIRTSERRRLRKNVLDLRENRRQISRHYDWVHQLRSERGLWPDSNEPSWRLDETEGPQRIRKKMERENEKYGNSRVDGVESHVRDVEVPEVDPNSALVQVAVPPWAESYEVASTEIEDRQLTEDIADDKHRRVRHELEPGDIIEAVGTVARVAGVDSSPGLLILGRTHLYMLDGLVESDDGVIIDAHDAPKRLFFVPGSKVELDGPQQAQRWSHDLIGTYSNKTFLFRDVALEIYFKDSRSLLVVFLDKTKRSEIDRRLSEIVDRVSSEAATSTPGLLKTPLFGRVGAKVLQGFRPDELSSAQRKWQAREISNYTYLSIINQISGRTPSDATQYPIFPWVLQDYTSFTLDLSNPDVYRDLTKPMGALTEARRESAQTKYANLESVGEQPFHYGTHFSSSMIVCHFLIRLAPFTHMFKTLQGGDWDLPDRLFSDVARAYESAARDVRGDVRELIPEFFTCPEFLENYANLDFGVQQNSGEKIHDVKLPPWAKKDPLLFITINRRALESECVSEHLPAWIDLIWGCKQRDAEALNVFHPLSYEGSIDLDSITDELEREATVGIIHNFGQTPRKLFNAPHPERYNYGPISLPIGNIHGIEEDPFLLVQGSRCFKDLGPETAVRDMSLDMIGEKILPCARGEVYVPSNPCEQLRWGSDVAGGDELRYLVDNKVVQVVEAAFCTCVAFADPSTFASGSSDHTVRLWKIRRGSHSPSISLSHVMRIHTDTVICVAASRAWSLVVSGSADGSAALWDLNRGRYVRSIWHTVTDKGSPIELATINESTGYIATCSRRKLCLHTVNARLIVALDLTDQSPITSMSFHEREYSRLGILATGGADGSITLRTWTADGTSEGEAAQWEFVTIRSMKVRAVGRGVSRPPAVTALKFIGESLCHGEETGKAFLWSLPE